MKTQNVALKNLRPRHYPSPPPAFPAMRIGLLGGSFDPAHGGHVQISTEAIKRLGLDQLWWLVSPQNPLKPRAVDDLYVRRAGALRLVRHPRIVITTLEQTLGFKFSAETIAHLTRRYPATRFVWLMGADNLVEFHHWRRWRDIFGAIPIAVVDRPGYRYRALNAPAARHFETSRRPESVAPELARLTCPAWIFLSLPLNPLSSTQIREKAGTVR